jgi:hypothetical protein
MKASRFIPTLAIALSAVATVPSATACEITSTPWGVRITKCSLGDLYQGRYDLMLDQAPVMPRLKLPNLRADGVAAGLIDRTAVLSVELVNDGRAGAGQFEATVVSSINDPANGGVTIGTVTQNPIVVSSLSAGTRVTKAPGHVDLPDRRQAWEICTVVVADPPPGGRPFGSVLEGNESDNQWSGCCTVAVGSAACR